jgi:hypothetical protein
MISLVENIFPSPVNFQGVKLRHRFLYRIPTLWGIVKNISAGPLGIHAPKGVAFTPLVLCGTAGIGLSAEDLRRENREGDSGMKKGVSIFGGLLFLALATRAVAAEYTMDSFRCRDQNLVTVGASMYEVRHECGDPDEIVVLGENPSDATWVYDMGRNDFIYYLEFSRGELRIVKHRGERGFK